MSRKTFQLNLTGPQSPGEVTLGTLADLLLRFERVVLAAALPDASSGELAVVSLVEIRTGSAGLVFSASPPALAAVGEISRAVAEGDLGRLSRKTHFELSQLADHVLGRGWGLAFVPDAELGVAPATITSGKGIPPPAAAREVQGDTSLIVRCLRVGGVQPKAEIRLQTGELLYPEVSEEIARQLGARLYDEVVVRGTAVWRTDDWRIVDLRILALSPFRKADTVAAFRELSESAQGRWEGVDARDYLENLASAEGSW